MTRALIPILLSLAATPLMADVLVLRNGGTLSGTIISESSDQVTIDIGAGRVGIGRARIAEIRRGASAVATFQDRASALAADDLDGWLELARWARENGLATQAGTAFERVLVLDPANAEAGAALGLVQEQGRWVTQDEAYRARGYVEYDGDWITPDEHAARLEERRIEIEERRLEADASIAEDEARAREAEARAREAEARAAEAEAEDVIVVRDVWPVGYGPRRPGRRPHRGHGRPGACGDDQAPCPKPTPYGGGPGAGRSRNGSSDLRDPAQRRAGH